MPNMGPIISDGQQNAYSEPFNQLYLADTDYEALALDVPDDMLTKMLVDSLEANESYWNQAPWKLQDTDNENVKYLLGNQLDTAKFLPTDSRYIDNRLFSSTRAILSYATGQLARPEITPSRADEQYTSMARKLQSALYQHAADEKVDQKVRAAVMNLLVRKRGYLKLRYDPNAGMYGDVVTEVCSPEDIIIDRNAKFMDNPNVIYHRVQCSIDELISRFPKKAANIKRAYSIKQGRFTQVSRFITYFEAWFTYLDKNVPKEGVCWFIPEHQLILDKRQNPNWVYTGDDKQDKETNVTTRPPKPFVWFNYLNLGRSFIDETCLFEQAKPQQEMLNKRGQQIWENADYVNGRYIASTKAFSEEDMYKLVNKGPKTVAGADVEDVTKAFANIGGQELPSYVYETLLDARNEVDGMMGTPSVFKGAQPTGQDTLGRDLLVKQQAGMLQDDLVRAIQLGMEDYYKLLLQMMRVYYTDDYWFQVKGGDGKYDFIMLNGESIDSNVKIGVQVDSTLPLDKESIRNTAMMLAKMGRIDQLTLLEDLGLPNPEVRTERLMRSQLEPMVYLDSVSQSLEDNNAESDIMLLTAGKQPEERDEYDESYLNYFNRFLTTNRFALLPQDAKERLVTHLASIQHVAAAQANLQGQMLDTAGMLDQPPPPPLPKVDLRLQGKVDPATAQAAATGQPLQPSQTPQTNPSAPPAPPTM